MRGSSALVLIGFVGLSSLSCEHPYSIAPLIGFQDGHGLLVIVYGDKTV